MKHLLQSKTFLVAVLTVFGLALATGTYAGQIAGFHKRATPKAINSAKLGKATAITAVSEVYLRAEPIDLTMPDGEVITMWGFAQDSSFGAMDGTVTVPGPQLSIGAGGGSLIVHLDNNLPEPISLVIPGNREAGAGNPVRIPGNRVRSFVHETAPGNTTASTYTWNLDSGSYIYHSGSHIAVQVQMGLYGAVTVNEAANTSYPGASAYDNEVIVFLHEIDPTLHNAVATDNYGPGKAMPSTINYTPDYFLINGEPFSEDVGFNPNLAAGTTGETTLIRFFNVGLIHHAPMILNQRMEVIAEDGYPYTHSKDQQSLYLAPMQTKDVYIRPTDSGLYPLFDRRMFLSNGMDSNGGMLRYLEVAPAVP